MIIIKKIGLMPIYIRSLDGFQTVKNSKNRLSNGKNRKQSVFNGFKVDLSLKTASK
jgi:hypothetical protein